MCIYLPESLQLLIGHERTGTPKMTIYSKILRPDKMESYQKNWEETVLCNGTIFAPDDTKEYYKSSIFKNLTIIAQTSVKNISLDINEIKIYAGESLKINAIVSPDDADNKTIIWSSSNETVAKVDDNGEVVAQKGGEATIIAKSESNPDITAQCMITVIQPVTGIVFNTNNIELTEDETTKIVATILPEDASNKKVNWTSSDVSVAMVSQDGTVYAIKPGQATIMATTDDGGFVALCKVNVKAKTIIATDIHLSSDFTKIAIGDTFQINATLTPENVSSKTINWTSTNPTIAIVDSSGLVKALSEGKTQIIATTTDGSGLSAICEIIVEKQFISITQIIINPTDAKLELGKSLALNTVIVPNDATIKSVAWSSTNPSVATVTQDGIVSAISEGEATIIASSQDGSNLSATCHILVSDDTGIETIIADKNTYVKIYDLNGYLIYEGIYAEARIDPGIYIVLYNGKSFKTKLD